MIRRMLQCTVVAVGLVVAAPSPAVAQDASAPLDWLVGCWRMERGATVIDEHWGDMQGGLMLGTSRTVRNGRAVEHEFSRIVTGAAGTVFEAMPSGQSPASFPAVLIATDSVVFANPAHDFPKRIVYRRISVDSVHANVEGDGRRFDFPYARVECGGGGRR